VINVFLVRSTLSWNYMAFRSLAEISFDCSLQSKSKFICPCYFWFPYMINSASRSTSIIIAIMSSQRSAQLTWKACSRIYSHVTILHV
jgi:hypothetical protein